jgi:signal transduction histidine kinase
MNDPSWATRSAPPPETSSPPGHSRLRPGWRSRVAQEALTNARKHAPGSPVTLGVRAVDGRIDIRVDDDGAAACRGRREAARVD